MRVSFAGPAGLPADAAVTEGAGHRVGNGDAVASAEPRIRVAIGVARILGALGVAARHGADRRVLGAAAIVRRDRRANEVGDAVIRARARRPRIAGMTSAELSAELVADDALQAHMGHSTERGASLAGIATEAAVTAHRIEQRQAVLGAIARRAGLGPAE